MFKILRPASQPFKTGSHFFIFKTVSAFILYFKQLKYSNTHTQMCEYISSCIWFLLNAGSGGEYFSEPMRRRKPIFLRRTCLPSVIFNILPFISFHRAHCQTCVGLRLYLNYKPLKSISRHDFPPPLPVLSSFPSLKPLLLQPYGLPYKGLLHFDHTTPCLPQGFSSN